jgi:hypothetical protein
MQLRWLVQENEEPTISQIKELRDARGLSLETARKSLLNTKGPTLQYLSHETFEIVWVDVPVVTETRVVFLYG